MIWLFNMILNDQMISNTTANEPVPSLFQRVNKGGLWRLALQIARHLLLLARVVFVARLLSPDDFGLMGIAMLSLGVLEHFSSTGFNLALIQKKGNIDTYLNTAWTVGILRGISLFIILLLGAPYAAQFSGRTDTELIIQVMGISLLLTAFNNISTVYFQKELLFNKLFILQIGSPIVSLLITIIIAVNYPSVWALVFGKLAGNLTNLFLSYILHPYRPRLNFDAEKTKELWVFGKWIFGSTILGFLLTQGDDIFVLKMAGASALGFYRMAYMLSEMPATEISHVISSITYPAYAKLQDNIPRLRDAYLKVLLFTAFLSFPLAGLIFIMAPDFVLLFMREKWLPMVPAVQILIVGGLARSIGTTTGQVFLAMGKPRIITKINVFKLVLLVILIYPLTKLWDFYGTAVAVSLAAFINQPILQFMLKKVIHCQYRDVAKRILIPLLMTLIMVAVISGLKILIGNMTIGFFFLVSTIGILTYISVAYIIDRTFNYGIKQIIQEQLAALK